MGGQAEHQGFGRRRGNEFGVAARLEVIVVAVGRRLADEINQQEKMIETASLKFGDSVC